METDTDFTAVDVMTVKHWNYKRVTSEIIDSEYKDRQTDSETGVLTRVEAPLTDLDYTGTNPGAPKGPVFHQEWVGPVRNVIDIKGHRGSENRTEEDIRKLVVESPPEGGAWYWSDFHDYNFGDPKVHGGGISGNSPQTLTGSYARSQREFKSTWTITPGAATTKTYDKLHLTAAIFIQRDGYGSLVIGGKGKHSGKTAVQGVPLVGDCYLTDQRGFDSSPSASARIRVNIDLDLKSNKFVISKEAGRTTEVKCDSGDEDGVGIADLTKLQIEKIAGDHLNQMKLRLVLAASDPLVYAAKFVGEVDLVGTLTITVGPGRQYVLLDFDGKSDPWPSYEMWATADISDGSTTPSREIFKEGPLNGTTVRSLMGFPGRPIQSGIGFYVVP